MAQECNSKVCSIYDVYGTYAENESGLVNSSAGQTQVLRRTMTEKARMAHGLINLYYSCLETFRAGAGADAATKADAAAGADKGADDEEYGADGRKYGADERERGANRRAHGADGRECRADRKE